MKPALTCSVLFAMFLTVGVVHNFAQGPQATVRFESFARMRERPQRIVVVLEEVPHRDEVEARVTDLLLIEQPTVELSVLQRGTLRQIDKIDTGDMRPAFPAHAFRRCFGRPLDGVEQRPPAPI